MLTAKGLVSARPRQGPSVAPAGQWNLFDIDVLRWTLEREYSLDLLRQFNQLRVAIEPAVAALAALSHKGADLDLDASHNPFFAQFKSVVATALHTSIRFTNTLRGRVASVPDHAAVAEAIGRRDADAARTAMARIIGEVLALIGDRPASAAEQ